MEAGHKNVRLPGFWSALRHHGGDELTEWSQRFKSNRQDQASNYYIFAAKCPLYCENQSSQWLSKGWEASSACRCQLQWLRRGCRLSSRRRRKTMRCRPGDRFRRGVVGPPCSTLPRGSEYPNSKVLGPKIHTLNGFWGLEALLFGFLDP